MRITAAVVAIIAIIGVSSGFMPDTVREMGFRAWMAEHNKVYASDDEFNTRFANYKANMARAAEANARQPLAEFGHTPFSDMSFEEFSERYLGRVSLVHEDIPEWKPSGDLVAVPDAHDWRDEGLVMPVRDQGSCGSCWAFGAAATIESAMIRAGGEPQHVSTSMFVDCDSNNGGCRGGDEFIAFGYAIENGVVAESDYPYEPSDRPCSRSDDMPVIQTFSDRGRGPLNDEVALVEFVHETGVTSIGIYVDSNFMNYKSGILTECASAQANHAVNIVGWGEEDGTPFWIVKNSWGSRWGEDGYIRIERNRDLCAISKDVAQIYV